MKHRSVQNKWIRRIVRIFAEMLLVVFELHTQIELLFTRFIINVHEYHIRQFHSFIVILHISVELGVRFSGERVFPNSVAICVIFVCLDVAYYLVRIAI